MMKFFIFIYAAISMTFLSSCNGQQKEKTACINKDLAVKIISELTEVKKDQRYIDSLSQHKRGVSYMIEDEKIKGEDYYQIKIGYNGKFHWETYNIFYVNKRDCNIYIYI